MLPTHKINPMLARRLTLAVFGAIMLLAALLLTGSKSASASPSAQTTPSAAPSSTVVKLYAPFTDMGGTLSIGLAVTDKLTGTCFASSVADPFRADAFRCMAGNRILDPCLCAESDCDCFGVRSRTDLERECHTTYDEWQTADAQ